jgi:hypothetical protein
MVPLGWPVKYDGSQRLTEGQVVSTRPASIPSTPAEILKTHYGYELDMLQKTYAYLAHGKHAGDEVAENALIESFCIHARALIEFFGRKSVDGRYRADSYTNANYTELPIDEETLKKLRRKLNKQIAHLDSPHERTSDPTEKIGRCERDQLLTILKEQSEEFSDSLKAGYRCLSVPTIVQQVISNARETTTNSVSIDYKAGFLRESG